ncbi:MAG: hypothetical protein LBN41_04460 [Enterobacteriaceae bacterium]|jgi:Asp-tRNA(Asn)/Glu-tRNA(Gln) amidotransferase A subunit family amidase|nr:hypothetical protein [Enterobacteriaceae bacterium]
MAKLSVISSLFVAGYGLVFTGSVNAFNWSEATIDSLHNALKKKEVSCEQVVQGYLDRIAQFDKQFNSIITINPQAITEAQALDKQPADSPMYCVPIIVKDNIDTADMPTTAGAIALKNNQPSDDAQVVKNLRQQGAIILAKSNLDEFAIAVRGASSFGGQTHNVYHLEKGPGGSSGGSATAVSASLGMVGLGSDTGGSIRIPASLAGLVGIRPTHALTDLRGVVPLSPTQDTVGPMCRTVRDCTYTLRYTENYSTPERQQQLLSALDEKGLSGAKIAMIKGMFPARNDQNADYWKVIDDAVARMRAAGATVEEVSLPEQEKIAKDYTSLSRYELRDAMTQYLSGWSSDKDNHLRSYDAILQSKGYDPASDEWLKLYNQAGKDKEKDPVYLRNLHGRQDMIRAQIHRVLDGAVRFDAIMYPTLTQLNVPVGKNAEGRANVGLSPFSGLPAITFPAGMTQSSSPEPVGIELLGREFDEPTLIRLVYGYEAHNPVRVAPDLAPELSVNK